MAAVNPEQLKEINIQEKKNSREILERYITGKHVSVQTLREQMLQVRPQDDMIRYITKEIPPYPTPVEFWISDVSHVTDEFGFKEILKSEQFRPPSSEFSWWDLKINKEEIKAAEMRYMESNFSKQAEDQKKQESFLETFTTSPVFKSESSRYGNYCFTFLLTDLMQWYKEQHCGGQDLVLRVYETITYKQEIVYTVLIHSPDDNQRFIEYPLLEASEWVKYQDGRIIWKAQAICETHNFQFNSGKVQYLYRHEFYVWDQVSLVFHLPNHTKLSKGLKIPRDRLIKALEVCDLDEKINLEKNKRMGINNQKQTQDAVRKVSELKSELEEKKVDESKDLKMEVDT